MNNSFTHAPFFLFLCLFLPFSLRTFRGLAGACMNPGSIFSNSLFMHSLVCPITHSFLDGFQPNLSKYALPVILFSA